MKKNIFSIILFLGVIVEVCSAQDIPQPSADSTGSSAIKTGCIIAGSTAITLVLIHYDQETYNVIHGWKMNNPPIKNVSPVITNMGDGMFALGLFGGFGAYSLIFNDHKTYEVTKIGIESFLLTGFACQILKNTFGRERPSAATRDGGFWHRPFEYFSKSKPKSDGIASFDAFPSGHTTTAFSMATTLADSYQGTWVPYASYSAATLIAISRVMESAHWLSDCFAGALLGYYGTKLVEYLNYGSSSIALLPEVNNRQYGLALTAHF